MSTAQKVTLVKSVLGEYSLAAALAAAGLAQASWYYHQRQKVDYQAKYAHLQPALEQIARQHPAYGYRRTTSELQESYHQPVNHKVIQRLHQLWGLSLLRTTRAPKPSGLRQVIIAAGSRVNLVAQLAASAPLMALYTDFTELRYAGGTQKAYLMPILDHASKLVLGWAVGRSANRPLALLAWRRAREVLGAWGVDVTNLIIHHDQDAVYTSYDWTGQLLLRDRLHLSYTLDGARDNPEVEAFFSRFKNENRSLLLDAATIEALVQVVTERMSYYNKVRRHSKLGYLPPWTYLERWRQAASEETSDRSSVLEDHTKT
ncbi:MAG: transposase [Candidatus Promineifilaceae bacterium]